MKKISKEELKQLILDGISSEELKSRYVYSDVTDMSRMFCGCSSLKSVTELDTSNVTDMSFMFFDCSKLESINIYNFGKFNFSELINKFLKKKYPEIYI